MAVLPLFWRTSLALTRQIALQAVGQIENGFAGCVLEGVAAETGAERIGEKVAAVGQQQIAIHEVLRDRLEIVGAPVGAVHGVVALDEAVVPRYAGAEKAGSRHALLLNVHGDVDVQLPLQFG